jgi:hypothetical protein
LAKPPAVRAGTAPNADSVERYVSKKKPGGPIGPPGFFLFSNTDIRQDVSTLTTSDVNVGASGNFCLKPK